MWWILFAFSGPILWAISTHIDKHLVERYFKNSSMAVLMVFTALIGILMLPFIWWYKPEVLVIPWSTALIVIFSGILYMGAMLFYLKAILSEEASVVAPLFQAAPLFAFIMGYFVLGERLTVIQMIGGLLIIGGSLFLSVQPDGRRGVFKTHLVLMMLACAFFIALSSVIFKFFAVQDEFWTTTFWTYVGEAIFGIAILLWPPYFRQFIAILKINTAAVLKINGVNELINLAGGLGFRYALLFAPLSIVQAISNTTTLFVFIFGIILTIFFPTLGREDLSTKNLIRKGLSALLIGVGITLVNIIK